MRRIKEIFLCLMAACLFTACDVESGSDVIWDIAPVNFCIRITDSEGHDLLDSIYQENIIKDVTVSYQGEDYPLMTEQEYYKKRDGLSETRAYLPVFHGLLLRQYWGYRTFSAEGFEMEFGEFDGEENVDKRDITVNLPHNQHLHLAYKNSFRWKSNGSPSKKTVFYLNGQELKDDAGKSGYFNFRYSQANGYEYIPSKIK